MVRFINSNGTRLAYRELGQGTETMILLHGWVDRHERMLPLATQFSKRYRVIAMDVRGHGQSDKPVHDYQLPTLADDVAALCSQRGIRKPLIVGHSLGGTIAMEVAARHPGIPGAIVALEGVVLIPAPVRKAILPLREALGGPHWKNGMQGFVRSNFLPTDDQRLRDATLKELDRLPVHVHTGIFDSVMAWDAEQAVRRCKVPTLYIEGGSGLSDLAKFQALCPQLITGKTVGLGHNQMIATPEQVSTMIDRFTLVSHKK